MVSAISQWLSVRLKPKNKWSPTWEFTRASVNFSDSKFDTFDKCRNRPRGDVIFFFLGKISNENAHIWCICLNVFSIFTFQFSWDFCKALAGARCKLPPRAPGLCANHDRLSWKVKMRRSASKNLPDMSYKFLDDKPPIRGQKPSIRQHQAFI